MRILKIFLAFMFFLVASCITVAAQTATPASNADAGSILDAVCSPAARPYLLWLLGIVGVGNVIAWAKGSVAKLPAPVQMLIHFAALNWRKVGELAGVIAPVFLIAVLLSACGIFTGNPTVDLNTFATQVQSFNKDFLAKASAFNAQVVATVIPMGKSACSFASELNGVYQSAQGQALVQAGTSLTAGDLTATNASEAAVWAKVQPLCTLVDGADPSKPTAVEIAAVQALIANVPQLQSALGKIAPQALALIVKAS